MAETIARPVPKPRWPLAHAKGAAEELRQYLAGYCLPERFCIAGSVRRLRPQVGDLELLYIPRAPLLEVSFDDALDLALRTGRLSRRENKVGRDTWGPLIKLARHVATGLPVDLFAATPENWWNYLVCRTGPKESNLRIATAARLRGWKWEPYSSGFVREDGSERYAARSEAEVFEFVGLKYVAPEDR